MPKTIRRQDLLMRPPAEFGWLTSLPHEAVDRPSGVRGLQRRDEKGGDARPRRDLQERAARIVREEDEWAP